MTTLRKHMLFSAIVIVVTVIAYKLTETIYGSGSGFCCGAPARPSIKYLDYYLAGIALLGIITFIAGNIVILLRKKRA